MVCLKCNGIGHNSRTCKKQMNTVVETQVHSPKLESSNKWMEEEDSEILRLLRDEITWNYEEILKAHNNKFGKQRTVSTYKIRVKRIAQENGIHLKMNNRWSDDEKTQLIELVKSKPLNIQWDEISENMNSSEVAIKAVYYENVSALEHVKCCVNTIEDADILSVINGMCFECSSCKKMKYSTIYYWKSTEYCETCYNSVYGEDVEVRWRKVKEYAIQTNKTGCNLCEKSAVFDNSLLTQFHYDHIDMFNKSGSICEMVRTGVELTEIYEEMDKCQILCIPCHKVITRIENQCGFVRLKKQTEITEEMRSECSIMYQRLMNRVYDTLKCRNR